MSSQINTGTMNVNYPLPGVNNSSQGFRDNFTSIKTNFESAKTELDEILSKSLFKSPITGSTLANDLNNNIISNAQTLGFRSSTYNLGSNLSGTVTVDLAYGDVHYGDVTGDIALQFAKWAPNETYSSVQLILNVTAGQKINLPATATTGVIYGTSAIEGFKPATNDIVIPNGVTRVHFQFNSIDCGTTIEIVAVDRPRITQQVKIGTPWTVTNGTIQATAGTTTSTFTGATVAPVTGDTITDRNQNVIGTVASVSGGTITLVSASTLTYTGTFYIQSSKGNSGDSIGDLKTDDSYLYVCKAAYDGTTAIWKRISLGAY